MSRAFVAILRFDFSRWEHPHVRWRICLRCLTEKNNKWRRNLRYGDEVQLTLCGRKLAGKPTILADDSTQTRKALHDLLIAVPRIAPYYNHTDNFWLRARNSLMLGQRARIYGGSLKFDCGVVIRCEDLNGFLEWP